jgi:transcriptional regulator with XRE-family HTH domain
VSNSLPDILTRYLSEERYTAHEIADAMECSAQTVYAYASGDRNIPYKRAKRFARYAYNVRSDRDIQRDFCGPRLKVEPRGEASADGRIDDEVTALNRLTGEIIKAHDEGDPTEMRKRLADLPELAERFLAECDRLPD